MLVHNEKYYIEEKSECACQCPYWSLWNKCIFPRYIKHWSQLYGSGASPNSRRTRIPSLSIHCTIQHLLQRQKHSASGPHDLPHWFWEEFATELAPVFTAIFNSSLKVSSVPKVWKFADVLPLPMECPLNQCLPIKTYLINRHYHEIIRKKCVWNRTVAYHERCYRFWPVFL